MLRQRPKPETKIVTRRKHTNFEAFALGVANIVNDPTLNADTVRESLRRYVAPFVETETVEVTERRVA